MGGMAGGSYTGRNVFAADFSGLAPAPWMRDFVSAPQGTRLCSS
jgi:hypothetical protein